MKPKLKIWHMLLLILLLLFFFRSSFIYNIILLLISFSRILTINPSLAIQQLNINLIDNFISLFLISCAPIILYFFKNKINFLFYKLGFTESILVIIITFTLISPIAAPAQFNFQHNVSVSKLL